MNYIKKISSFILLAACMNGITSCSDYLDTYPKDVLTIDEVFQNKKYTEEYLASVYNYTRKDNMWSNDAPWTGLSDELDVTYPDYSISNMNLGSLNPGRDWYNNWTPLYKGVRSASYFMSRIDENPQIEEDLKRKYTEEARFLRVWHYFHIMRQYGPFVILPNEVISPEASIEEMTLPRSPISTCVDYMIGELNIAINSGHLPEMVPDNKAQDMGRVTVAACKALKSRILLYAASDLYNNDRNGAFYSDFKNKDGSLLLNYTDGDRITRWQKAADAAKEVMDMGFSLHKEYVGTTSNIDPYKSYKNLFIVDWNDEVIWAKPAGDFSDMNMAGNPLVVGGWNGWAPTQKMVDAYYTKNGLPIAGEAGFPMSKDPVYTEEGYTVAMGDDGYTQPNTFKMYTNREPRFYVSIMFNNAKTNLSDLGTNQKTVEFFYKGNSGFGTSMRNYPQTGYLATKMVHPDANPSTSKGKEHARIFFRLVKLKREQNGSYENPVCTDDVPDPTVIRVGKEFYMYGTGGITTVYKSTNLLSWEYVGQAFNSSEKPDFIPGASMWAPDINYIDGKYVLYFAAAKWGDPNCGIGVATSDKPQGPFKAANYKGKLFTSQEIDVKNSIDPCIIEDGSKKYMFWGSFNSLYATELTDNGLQVKDMKIKTKVAGNAYEGAYVHKRGKYFYLFASIGSCCAGDNSTYTMVVGRSENVLGPYVNKAGNDMRYDHHEILVRGDNTFVGPGHNSRIITDDEGNDWILYHAYLKGQSEKGRMIILDQVKWDSQDWPVISNGYPTKTLSTLPVFK